MLEWCRHVSPLRDDDCACHGLSQRLRMEAPRCDPPVDSAPPPANSYAVVGPPCLDPPPPPQLFNNATVQSAPDAPIDAPVVSIVSCTNVLKAKVPIFIPSYFFHRCSHFLHLCVVHFTSAHPKPPLINFPTPLSLWYCFIGCSLLAWWLALLNFFIGEAPPHNRIFRV